MVLLTFYLKKVEYLSNMTSLTRFAFLFCTLPVAFTSPLFMSEQFVNNSNSEVPEWLADFTLNLCGYAVIIIPGFLLVYSLKNFVHIDKLENGLIKDLIIKFVHGSSLVSEQIDIKTSFKIAKKSDLLVLIICSLGLLTSYLLWGVAQERIVSVPYTTDNKQVHFKDSLFLEFSNRIISLFASLAVLLFTHQPIHKTPIYKYSYNSFTCLMSSWCQYEALKYVSFPVQVLVKASKVIPVMAMGWFVSGKIYNLYEYFTAFLMSLGLFLFLLNNETNVSTQSSVNMTIKDSYVYMEWGTMSGAILMIGYIGFDSFTSNWQSELFHRHEPSHIQMMAGTNFFEILLASVSLFGRSGFTNAFTFAMNHPSFLMHVVCLAVTSASGQFFIFYTIQRFGPVTFTIIMTARQALSVLISCFVYHHFVGQLGIFGLVLFFSALTMWIIVK